MTVRVERQNLNRRAKTAESVLAENETFLKFLVEQGETFKKFEKIEFVDMFGSQVSEEPLLNHSEELESPQAEDLPQVENSQEEAEVRKVAVLTVSGKKQEKVEKIEPKVAAGVIDKRKKK